jgi:hypothetical protein
MKNCNPHSGHNGQLVHLWLLVHSWPLRRSLELKMQTEKLAVSTRHARPTIKPLATHLKCVSSLLRLVYRIFE